MNRTFNPKNSGHIVDKVKMSELDDAIGRYCEQWGEPEPEPLYDVLENVSDRFHFRHDNFIVGSGQPKRTFLPFYSHAGNVFDGLTDFESNTIDIDDVNVGELNIGVLEQLKERREEKCLYSIPTDYSIDDTDSNIEYGKITSLTNQNVINYIDNIIEELSKSVNPKFLIRLEQRVDILSGRSRTTHLNCGIFDPMVVHKFQDHGRNLMFSCSSNRFTFNDMKYVSNIHSLMSELLSYISNIYHKEMEEVVNDVYIGKVKFESNSLKENFCILKELVDDRKSRNMSLSEFNYKFNAVARNMFKISSAIANMLSNRINNQKIEMLIDQFITYKFSSYPTTIDMYLRDRFVNVLPKVILNSLKTDMNINYRSFITVTEDSIFDEDSIFIKCKLPKAKRRNTSDFIPSWE